MILKINLVIWEQLFIERHTNNAQCTMHNDKRAKR